MSIFKITYGDAMDAAARPDLNEAVRHIQDKAGITTGDVAGAFFPNEGYLDINAKWMTINPGTRCCMLIRYIEAEKENAMR